MTLMHDNTCKKPNKTKKEQEKKNHKQNKINHMLPAGPTKPRIARFTLNTATSDISAALMIGLGFSNHQNDEKVLIYLRYLAPLESLNCSPALIALNGT